MPEFYAEHVPDSLDDFTRGYLEAVEWLLDEEVDRNKIRGFSRTAIKKSVADCKGFQEANEADLAAYCELTGRGMSSAGHDYYLTRNRHGAGFWDRGNVRVFDRLTEAAQSDGENYSSVYRGWIQID